MPGFDFICPMNYPNRCDLPQTEVDYLIRKEGFKRGFLMYQFRDQDKYLVDTVKSYFEPRNCHILEAEGEAGSGVKICKICKLATASHFGIALLSPENLNVNLEIGLVWGQGKPVLFLANEKRLENNKELKDLSFDLSSFMLITYSTEKQLIEGLEREGPIFLEKVRVIGIYQQELVKSVRSKLAKLKREGIDKIEFLKMLLLMCKEDFGQKFLTDNIKESFGINHDYLNDYQHRFMEVYARMGFLEVEKITPPLYENFRYHFNQALLPILRQEAFKEI